MTRIHAVIAALMMFGALSCNGPGSRDKKPDVCPPDELPGIPLPDGFDIRVAGTVALQGLHLEVAVDVPEGSYVISALSDRDYLGKFQIGWSDSLVTATGNLVETPVSMPGWEPWDEVYTPMLFSPTVIRQSWALPPGADTLKGEIFFVLEPQCVPYAVDFTVVPATGEITSGLIHPQYPD